MSLAGRARAQGFEEVRTLGAAGPAKTAILQRLLDHAATAFAFDIFQTPEAVVPYRLLSPSGVRQLPMVVVLHGSGQMGVDNKAQLGPFAASWVDPKIAARFPAFVVAPQVATRSADYAPDSDGLPSSRPGSSLAGVQQLIEHLANNLPIDRSRLYLTGFSMGASAALQAVVAKPCLFAAVAAFSPVPPPRRFASEVIATPELLVHGSADTENPFEADHRWASALADVGAKRRFIVYEGMDHRVPLDMLLDAEWRSWMFSQRRRSF
jgi:poly(3-hydroxybutyrate) depolymerase